MIDQNQIKAIFGADAALSFYQHSRQSYGGNSPGKDILDELMIGIYEDDHTIAEFSIKEFEMGDVPFLGLDIVDESWHLMPYLSDFFDLLSKSKGISLDELAAKLIKIGFVDRSDRQIGSESEMSANTDLFKAIDQIENHLKEIDRKSPAFAIYSKALAELKALL
jgi:hypothetical protein